MIARRASLPPLARVDWTVRGRKSLARLTRFFYENHYGDPDARSLELRQAIQSLRCAPLRCPVVGIRHGLAYRRLVVGRFLVFYVYVPPETGQVSGTLSIRAVKHGGIARPFAGVREVSFEEMTV